MLKYISTSCLCAFFSMLVCQQANGQAALFVLLFGDKVASEKFHLSMDGGLNVSSLPGFDDGRVGLGPYFGLGTHLKFNDHWYLQSEFKPLSVKGVADVKNPILLPEEYAGSETKSNIRLNYLEIPVLAQYRFSNGLYFSAGPQISFLTSAKQKTAITLPGGTLVNVEQNLEDHFEGIDYSIPVEIGYAITKPRGGKGVDFRLRYTYGLGNVFKDLPGYSANNSTFQIILAFPFITIEEDKPVQHEK